MKSNHCSLFLTKGSDPRGLTPLFRFVTVGVLCVFCLSSCTIYRPLRISQEIKQLPEEYATYYDYPKGNFNEEILEVEETKSYTLKKIVFDLQLPKELQLNDFEYQREETKKIRESDRETYMNNRLLFLNQVDLYIPKDMTPGEKRPTIIISPILGGNMVVDRFAKYYAGRGYVAALVHRRKVKWDDKRGDIAQMENYLRASIIRLRQALDFLETQPEVDANRIGAFGVSYGAILHSVLAAVDQRPKYHVLAMPAGPLSDVIVNCPDKAITKIMSHVQTKYGWSKEKIREDLHESIKTDPMLLAPYVPRHKIEVYVAMFDRVVGARRSFNLWKTMNKPKLQVMPFGHYGGVLIFPYLQTKSFNAFKKHLAKAGKS